MVFSLSFRSASKPAGAFLASLCGFKRPLAPRKGVSNG